MFKRIVIVMVICFMGVAALAEDWQKGRTGIEYDCDLLTSVMQAFQDNDGVQLTSLASQTLVRSNNTEVNVSTYFGLTETTNAQLDNRQAALLTIVNNACNPDDVRAVSIFNVQINDGANIRACGSTDCAIVREANGGEMLTVVGIKGDWYEVREGDSTAFIASFLVRRVMCL